MMIINAYSLLDTKTGLYAQPWFFHHDVIALRAVQQLGSDKTTQPGMYPNDFVLYKVGLFDDNTGNLAATTPYNMGSIAALLAAAPDVSAV